MYRFVLVLVGVVALVGCKKTAEPMEGEQFGGDQAPSWQPVEPAPTMESPTAQAPPEMAPMPEAAPAAMPYPQAVASLRESVNDIRNSTDPSHAELVQALRTLGDAVMGLPQVDNAEKYRTDMQTYADRLATMDPASMEHGDVTKAALRDTLDVLRKAGKDKNIEAFDSRLGSISDQIDAIDAKRALTEQRDLVAAPLEQIVLLFEQLTPAQTGTR